MPLFCNGLGASQRQTKFRRGQSSAYQAKKVSQDIIAILTMYPTASGLNTSLPLLRSIPSLFYNVYAQNDREAHYQKAPCLCYLSIPRHLLPRNLRVPFVRDVKHFVRTWCVHAHIQPMSLNTILKKVNNAIFKEIFLVEKNRLTRACSVD